VAAELARLRDENARLLKMLELSPRQAAPVGPAQAGFFDAPPGAVHQDSPNDAKVAFFRALFPARTDIYATRVENSPTRRGYSLAGKFRATGKFRTSRACGTSPLREVSALPAPGARRLLPVLRRWRQGKPVIGRYRSG